MDCPVCGGEVLVGIANCSACAASLAVELPRSDVEEPIDDPLVPAAEVWSPAEAAVVCSLLQAHEIPYILKAENQYAVDASYTVGPLARRRILVQRSDLNRAREILAPAQPPDPPDED
jgi:hypothetical protein